MTRAPYKVAAALLLILILAGALRIYGLGGESLWLDEAVSVMNARLPAVAILNISGEVRGDIHPPLYYLALHAWMGLAGDSEASVRAPSAVFGLAAVALVFFIGLELWGAPAALAAAFLSAVSWHFVQLSQEARMYALMLLLSAASYYFFIRMVRRGETGGAALGYAASTALLLYSHYYALFIVLAQAAAVGWLWRSLGGGVRQRWFWSMALVAAAFVPWTPTLLVHLHRAANRGLISTMPDLHSLAVLNTTWASSHFRLPLGPFSIQLQLVSAVVLDLLALAGLYAAARRDVKTRGRSSSSEGASSRECVVLGLWAAVPVLVPFALAQAGTLPFQPRYMIGAAPAYYLLAARGLMAIERRSLAWGLLAAVFALGAPGLADYYRLPQKEQWREVARLVEREGRPGDLIALAPSYLKAPFNHYYRGGLKWVGLSEADTPEGIARKLGVPDSLPGRIWLVHSHRKQAYETALGLIASEPSVRYEFLKVEVLLFELRGPRAPQGG